MDNEHTLIVNGELYHWGIKGMRWGIRKYQNPDGSLTAAGKKRYNDELRAVKAKTKALKEKQAIKEEKEQRKAKLKAAKQELEDLKKGKKADPDKPAESDSDKKARLLREPNAKEVLANRHLFNDREVQSIRLRLNEEKMIADMAPPDIDKGKAFVDKTCDKFDQVARLADNGSRAWNGVAKIYNAFLSEKTGIELPMIDGKVKSKADKIKEKAELVEAENRLKKAQKDSKEKEKTELEKLKELTETEELNTRLAKAQRDNPNRERTADEEYAAETRRINAELARQKADNDLREQQTRTAKLDQDEADAKTVAETKKITLDTDRKNAENKNREADIARSKLDQDEVDAKYTAESKATKRQIERAKDATEKMKAVWDLRKENERQAAEEAAKKAADKAADKAAKAERKAAREAAKEESRKKNESRTLRLIDNRSNSKTLSPSMASKIRAMTASGNKSNSEIAKQLGVSTSTVQNYSRGKEYIDSLEDYDLTDW